MAAGKAEEVRQQLGRTERVLAATLLERHSQAAEWLAAQPGVHDLQPGNPQLVFGFRGSDEAQAALVDGLVRHGFRLRALEERRSSFEDILVEVAENNRRQ
jgi:hypothetical protein